MNRSVAVASILALASPCIGAGVSFSFNIAVTSIYESSAGLLGSTAFSDASLGDVGTLSWIWDDTAFDNDGTPYVGYYFDLLTELKLTIGSQSFFFAPLDSSMLIVDDVGGADELHGQVHSSVGGSSRVDAELYLADLQLSAFSSDELPALINQSDFEHRSAYWSLDLDGDHSADVRFDLAFVDGPAVPLPSGAGLTASGLAMLAQFTRRRRH